MRTITVDGNDPPELIGVPNDVEINCTDPLPNWDNIVTAIDDCSPVTVIVTVETDDESNPPDGTNCCASGDKVKQLFVRYTGEDCSATNTTQGSNKYSCSGDPNFDSQVYIISNDETNPNNGDRWFEGIVGLNEVFSADATLEGKSKLDSRTYFHIYDQQGGNLLQTVEIHTSCSVAVVVGEQVGSLIITTTVMEDGSQWEAEEQPRIVAIMVAIKLLIL